MNDWQDAEQHVERAHELYELGRWDEAEQALRYAISLNPFQSEWQFNLGLTLAASGRSEQAIDAFARSHDLAGEGSTQAALEIAAIMIELNRAEEAERWLGLVLVRDPGSVDAHVQMIDACALRGQHDQAEVHFYLALQIDPACASAYSTMAESLMDRRLFDRAAWCLREAARLDPSLQRVSGRLASAYAQTGRLERARQLYLRELRSNPGDADTIVDLGRLLMDMHRLDEAGEKLRRALELQPDHVEAHMLMGELAERLDQPDLARQHYGVVVRLDASAPAARRRLAGVLLEARGRGDLDRARVLLREEFAAVSRTAAPPDSDELEDLVGLLLDASLASEAVSAAGILVRLREHDARAHHLASVAMLSRGMIVEGMEAARRAVRLSPSFIAPMHNLAVAHIRRAEFSRAAYWVRRGMAIDADDRALRRLRTLVRVHALRFALDRVALFFRRSRR